METKTYYHVFRDGKIGSTSYPITSTIAYAINLASEEEAKRQQQQYKSFLGVNVN